MIKRIALLGSTGSIGIQALEVINDFPEVYKVELLTGYTNVELLHKQCRQFNPRYASLADLKLATEAKRHFEDINVRLIDWSEIEDLIMSEEIDVVFNSLVGAAGITGTVGALKAKKRLLLANKESLVIGGEFLEKEFPDWRQYVFSVDSEHSAIFQCLLSETPSDVSQLILTASGGPFKNLSPEELKGVTPEDALKHPTWRMGKKITVDSATLMNKGLEVIEAHHLFKMPYERIKVIIHPQSIVHGMVLFRDCTIKAILSNPDMKLPIEYALFYPNRKECIIQPLSLDGLSLTFESPAVEKFPCLRIAVESGKRGGNYPVLMNAANEVAVTGYLSRRIKFTDIPVLIEKVLDAHAWASVNSLDEIKAADASGRRTANEFIKNLQ